MLLATKMLHEALDVGDYVVLLIAKSFPHEPLACIEKVLLRSPQDCSEQEDWFVHLLPFFEPVQVNDERCKEPIQAMHEDRSIDRSPVVTTIGRLVQTERTLPNRTSPHRGQSTSRTTSDGHIQTCAEGVLEEVLQLLKA